MTNPPGATADLLHILKLHCPATATATEALLVGDDDGLAWTPMTLGDIPGVSEVLGLIEPPVKVVEAFLKVVSGVLDILQTLLIALTDPIRAIVMAAYEILKTLIDDFLATGAYFYVDIPGILSNRKTLNDMGASIPEPPTWLAGGERTTTPKPAEGFEAWAETFKRSFDDPGDEHRPQISDGSPVEALFIVATFPNMVDFTKFGKLWSKLLDLKEFEKIIDDFDWKAFDLDRNRLRGKSVAPDWRSWKLRDVGPEDYPLRHLEKVPEILKGILANADNLIETLGKLIKAVQNKVKILEDFIKLIDSVLDILRALSATGLHALPVVTPDGVEGLTKAFLEAKNRPDTQPATDEDGNPVLDADGNPAPRVDAKASAIAGACFMTGSSGAVPFNPQMLWAMLGQGKSFQQAYSGTIEDFKAAGDKIGDAWDDIEAAATEAWEGTEGNSGVAGKGVTGLWNDFRENDWEEFKGDMEAYFKGLPEDTRTSVNTTLSMMGLSLPEADALFRSDRDGFMRLLELSLAAGGSTSPHVMAHLEATRRARQRGARGMAAAAAAGLYGPPPGGA